MQKFNTSFKLMTERLDVNYYKPIFINNQQKIEIGKTKEFNRIYIKSGIGHTASIEPHYSQNGLGIPYISGKVLKSNQILIDIAERIKLKSHHEVMSKSKLKPGYLLMVRKGDVGNPCIVSECMGELNCSSEIMFFELSNNENPYYLVSFFNSDHGSLATTRLQRGSLIPGVSLLDLPTLKVFYPDRLVQNYIGDKVRLAEKLRERSKELEKSIQELTLTSEIDKALNSPNLRCNNVKSVDLEPRLDTKFYNYRSMQVLKACKNEGIQIGDLIKNISNGFECRQFVDSGIPYITVSEVSSGRLNLSDAPHINSLTTIPSKAKINKNCVLVVRTGSVGTAVKVYEEDEKASISSHLIRLEFVEESIAAIIATFLNSSGGSCLLHKISYGAVQPQIGQDELLNLSIPKSIFDKREYILSCVNTQEQAIRNSKKLTTAAKYLVEALIEGKLTEIELKNAQTALQKGDIEPDKAILAKLTRKGYDIANEPPLFPDLDALYQAIRGIDL